MIAELSGNHNQDLTRAVKIIKAAKTAGANAVKLQTYTADTITLDHDSPDFRITDGLWKDYSLYDLYDKAHTPWDWYPTLLDTIRDLQMDAICTPFDQTAVEFLEDFNIDAFKIASFEIVDHALISTVARTGKPIIISTGMANFEEISEAIAVARDAGAVDIAILHCVSGYPTPVEDVNLRTIAHLSKLLDVVAGLSDHTLGVGASIAAVALEASIIEKHLTLNRSDGGLDAEFSLEPSEFEILVNECQSAWKSIGEVNYRRTPSEEFNMVFRRSLYVVKDISYGDLISCENVRSIRPGYGLAPKHLPHVLGRKTTSDLTRGTALDWSMISD